ncbi:biopolymer transporter ExbD [Bremerella cremea]|uniref:Biopolymer transporter ExbD n=1 Tax=Bremerella cremea TaxID=1031537 RepID=A0A368KVM1_9BACT|nr:biopolymer transporter ExbD [Bremerella cremea]RCS52781.1 biopolymer transporter ExbD [Bremerella cremea]
MRLSKKRVQHTKGMDITPMIDIVFLLLIFFITVTQVSETNREKLELPELKGAEDQKKTSLVINVRENGQIIVADNPLEVADVAFLVGKELETNGGDPGLVTVVVRIDQRATCEVPNALVKQLASQGISKVRLAVQVPQ